MIFIIDAGFIIAFLLFLCGGGYITLVRLLYYKMDGLSRKFAKFIFTNLVEKVYRCVVNGRFPGTLGKHRKSAYILFY
ncbi:hypothetical protein ROSINTL182_06135 [Roseburia intestinalis L1-82]|uniref:Uncharacterized protein n=1 Tax=Roseburia intestinalis L1-82 TaxID=536231 RepID=C7G8B0_9FIRM|nr:hypothetical protein ROSINTL182_06135 [Roseburia intestinalis L1-82]MBD9183502.1 hypothetical protein [Roseburia intestinalis]